MDINAMKFRDIAVTILDDRPLSSDDLLFLFDFVLEYLDENNMHPSYEYLRLASDRLFLSASGKFLRDYRDFDKTEGGE